MYKLLYISDFKKILDNLSLEYAVLYEFSNFCTQLTFDLILRLGVIFRLGIHPGVFPYILSKTFSMDTKMYSKMPTETFLALRIDYYQSLLITSLASLLVQASDYDVFGL